MTDPTGELDCLTLAARQLGAVQRTQALSAGMSPREIEVRLEKGLWSAPQRGVYVVAGVPESWEQLAMIAQLRGGPKATLSHLTAAHLIDLSSLKPVVIDLTRPRALKAAGIRAHRGFIAGDDVVRRGPFRTTSPRRTLVDLAGVLDFARLEDCLEEALFRGMLDIAGLTSALAELGTRGRTGSDKLRRLLKLRDPSWAPTENKFETLLQRVLRNARLPLPERQVRIFDCEEFVTRIDFAYERELIGIPADSYQWHGRRRSWERDIEQRNRLLRMGWRLRPTTWTELKRFPARFTSDIEALLRSSV
jgi:hypothetical protein